jgi:hypothetical protein
VVSNAPSRVAGDTLSTWASGAATRAILKTPGATARADEMNAQHVELALTSTAEGLTPTAPNQRIAPAGNSKLFALTADGISSVAGRLHVGPPPKVSS